MKTIYLGSFQIHTNTGNIGYAVNPPISGLEMPVIRTTQYNRPGEYGAIVSNMLYGGRRIGIEGIVSGSSLTDYEGKRKTLEQNLGITRDINGAPVATILKFTTMDDIALQCNVYCLSLKFEIINLLYGKYRMDLFSPDFALFTQLENSSTITRASGGGAVYPIIYPIIYGASTGGTGIIVNAGTTTSFPTIYLNGPLNNPIIQNSTVGRFIELSTTLGVTDQIVIDMKNKTIILNGSTSVISTKTSASLFWWLESGSNTINFYTSSSSDTGNAQIKWRDAYLGV